MTSSRDTPCDADPARVALRIVSIGLGIFFLFMSLNKMAWLGDPNLLAERFQRWLPDASWYAQPYLRAVAIPGAAIFARLVPIGEFCTAVAMLTGVRTNIVAGFALFMILNFHTATSSFSSTDFLRDGTGPPLVAALLALAFVKGRLPFSLRKP